MIFQTRNLAWWDGEEYAITAVDKFAGTVKYDKLQLPNSEKKD